MPNITNLPNEDVERQLAERQLAEGAALQDKALEAKAPKGRSTRGRAATLNPKNRFELLEVSDNWEDYNDIPEDERKLPTQLYKDTSQTIITSNNSPDIPFSKSLNPYRGCEHGCIYCYARQTHEYLGFSLGVDFETKIMVKEDAAELLRKELSKKSWEPQPLMFAGVTDIYQPIERKLKITRQCLEVLADFKNPVAIVTKNHLITRDIDVLQKLADFNGISVAISITTLNDDLRKVMEPRTSPPKKRLEAIKLLNEAGIRVGVMTAPIIPGLTDHEIPDLLDAAAEAGAQFAGYNIVHLPFGTKELFVDWLETNFPERAEKVINRIKAMRGGKLNDPRFGYRMRGEGVFAEQIKQMYKAAKRKTGLDSKLDDKPRFKLSTEHFKVPGSVTQPGLFDGLS